MPATDNPTPLPAGTSSPPPPAETASRIVNGLVVVAALGIAALVFNVLQDKNATAFGAFTTLVGTAIAAYFGISATREASRNAVETVAAATQQSAARSEEHGAAAAKLAAVKSAVANNDPANSGATVAQLRNIVGA